MGLENPGSVDVQKTLMAIYKQILQDLWLRLKQIAEVPYYLATGNLLAAYYALREASKESSDWYTYTRGEYHSLPAKTQQFTNDHHEFLQSKFTYPDAKFLAQSILTSDMSTAPAPYELWQHYKGPVYPVITTSIEENTLTPLVTYHSHRYGTNWSRRLENWHEDVDHSGETIARFRRYEG